jgi:multisubunit Na+/H+ antiporter MnhF subunit
MDKAKLGLIVVGSVTVCELALIGILAGFRVGVPDQAWSLVYATLGVLGGVAGAQYLNGKTTGKPE